MRRRRRGLIEGLDGVLVLGGIPGVRRATLQPAVGSGVHGIAIADASDYGKAGWYARLP
ncbi:MAG: hypothetical protein HKP61_12590 [Dactylosporangium sp.]|nr:hypothetical protein [Dactylosporangium sp.]